MIKVYFANIELLDDPEVFSKGLKCVQPMRREKVLRFKQEIDKKRSLLAGMLLKIALEKEGFSYETLDFELETHGRPIIKNADNIYFSLSHSGNYALCCISDQLVGVDMEGLERAVFKDEKAERMHAMAKKILSESEYEKYLQCDEKTKGQLLLKYWTRKESYSKAQGEGLRMTFSNIDTEKMEDCFWSGWLEAEYFISVYGMRENSTRVELHKVLDLEI